MAKALNVSLAVTADTSQAKAQLQQLQTTLQQLTANSANLKLGINPSEIQQASTAALQLAAHLKQATDVNTGTLNFTKFESQIRRSGQTIEGLGTQLLQLGPQGQQAFNQLAQAIAKSEIPMKRISSIFGQFGTVIANTVRWQMSSSLIHGIMSSIQGAYRYAQDLNESLNNIQIVTQMSDTQMGRFAESANKAAKALSTTTTSYTDAALIYYQQGIRDQNEINERTSATIKMANVTGQSAEKVSNQMTAIWNNFAKGGDNLEYYADVITALGAATASSSEEISRGLEKFAATADTVGLSYENATAALATITATTRQSADTVGTGLRTLFARLDNLKLGETLEDGVDLTKYTKALQSVGVQVLDTNGNLKRMDDILNELGEKWGNISDTQKVALAQTVGGVRQYTTLMALMNNFDFYKENVDIAKSSEGTLQRQQEVYEKSWEASSKRVRASMETIFSTVISDQFFINLNDGFANFLSIINNIIKGLGGMKGLLLGLGGVLGQVFQPQITQGLYNFGMGMADLFTSGKASSEARTRTISNLASIMSGAKYNAQTGTVSGMGQMAYDSYSKLLQNQVNFAQNAALMTPVQQRYAQMVFDNQQQSIIRTQQAQQNAAQARQNAKNLQYDVFQQTRERTEEYIQEQMYTPRVRNQMWQNAMSQARGEGLSGQALDQRAAALYTQSVQNYNPTQRRNQLLTQRNQDINNILREYTDLDLKNKQAIRELQQLEQNPELLNKIASQTITGYTDKDLDFIENLENASAAGMLKRLANGEDVGDLIAEASSMNSPAYANILAKMESFGIDTSSKAFQDWRAGVSNASTAEIEKLIAEFQQKMAEGQGEDIGQPDRGKVIAQNITNVATGLMQASAAGQSLKSVVNIFDQINTGAISASDGIQQLASGLTQTAMQGMMAFNSLSQVVSGPWAAAITGLMVALPYIVEFIDGMFETTNEREARLSEFTDLASQRVESAKTAYNDLTSGFSSHNALLDDLKNLTQGTADFEEALNKANTAAENLINENDLVEGKDYYTNQNTKAIEFTAGTQSRLEAEAKAEIAQAEQGLKYAQLDEATNKYRTNQRLLEQLANGLNTAEALSQYDNLAKELGYTGGGQQLRELIDQGKISELQAANFQKSGVQKAYDALNTQRALSDDGIVSDIERLQNQYLANQFSQRQEAIESIRPREEITYKKGNETQYLNLTTFGIGSNTLNQFEQAYREYNQEAADKLASDLEYQKLSTKDKKKYLAALIKQEDTKKRLEALERTYEQDWDETRLNKFKDYRKKKGKTLQQLRSEIDLNNVTDSAMFDTIAQEVAKTAQNVSRTIMSSTDLGWTPQQIVEDVAHGLYSLEDLESISNYAIQFSSSFGKNAATAVISNLKDTLSKNSTELLDTLDSIDFSKSKISSLFNINEAIKNNKLTSDTIIRLQKIQSDITKDIGGEGGLFNALYEDTAFSDVLKKLTKDFKEFGDIGAKSILDAADDCEVLSQYLEISHTNAQGLATALELVQIGDIGADQITSNLLSALSAAGGLKNQLAEVFSFIDNYDKERSAVDIGEFFSGLVKDVKTTLGAGLYADPLLYQSWSTMFGTLGMTDLLDWERSTEGMSKKDRQASWNKNMGAYASILKQIETTGNMSGLFNWYQQNGFTSGDQWENALGQVGTYTKGTGGKVQLNGKDLYHYTAKEGLVIDNETEFFKQFRTQDEFAQYLKDVYNMTEEVAKATTADAAARSERLTEGWNKGNIAQGLEVFNEAAKNGELITLDELNAFRESYKAFSDELSNQESWNSYIKSLKDAGAKLVDLGKNFDYTKTSYKNLEKAMSDQAGETSLQEYLDTQAKATATSVTGFEDDSFFSQSVMTRNLEEVQKAFQNLGYSASQSLLMIDDGYNTIGKDGNKAIGELTFQARTMAGGFETVNTASKPFQDFLADKGGLAKGFGNSITAAIQAYQEQAQKAFDTSVITESLTNSFKNIFINDEQGLELTVKAQTEQAEKDLADLTKERQAIIEATAQNIESTRSQLDGLAVTRNVYYEPIVNESNTETEHPASGMNNAQGFAGGYHSNNDYQGIAETGELGPELWIHDGQPALTGVHGRNKIFVSKGDQIFTAAQTKEILRNNPSLQDIPGFERGKGNPWAEGIDATGKAKKSGGSSSDSKDDKGKDYKPERYHVVSRQLTILEKQYERLEKAKENAYGTNILDAIEDEIAAQDQVITKQRELIQEVEKWKAEDLKKLKELGVKYTLDANGEIANWDALQKKYEKAAQTSDDENAKKIWEAIQQYEETVDKLRDETDKLQEAIYKQMQLRLEKITLQAELKIKFDDKQIELLNYSLEKLEDNVYAGAEALALMSEQMSRVHDQIISSREAITGIFAEMTDSAGKQIDITVDEFLAMSQVERDALDINNAFGEALEEQIDTLFEQIKALDEYKKNGVDKLRDAFKELTENVDNALDKFSYFSGVLTTLRDIIDLQNIKFPKALRDSVKQVQTALMNTSTNSIKGYQNYYRSLAQEADALRQHLSETTDVDLAKQYQEQLNDLEDKMRDCMSNLNDLWQATLSQAKEDFEQQLDWLVEDYGEALSGIYGNLDMYGDAFDRERKVRDRYTEDYEKYYQLSKLQRSINKDLDKSAQAGYKGNKQLRDLLKEIEGIQESGRDMSAYELEVLEKRYEYFKALADLEEARDAKHTVRLQRDRNGNWGYVYTANEDELEDLQQKADDRLHELQQFVRSSQDDLEEQIQELYVSYASQRVDMIKQGASAEALAEFDQYYMDQLAYLRGQWDESLTDAGNTVDTARDRYKKDNFEIIDLFGETATAQLSVAESTTELLNNITTAMGEAAGNMGQLVSDYSDIVERLNELIGGDTPFAENLNKFVTSVNQASNDYLGITKDAVDDFQTSFDEILNAAESFEENFMKVYQPILDANEKFLKQLQQGLEDLNRYKNKNDKPNSTTSPSSPNTGSGSVGGSGGGNSGGGGSGGSGSGSGGSGSNSKKAADPGTATWQGNTTYHWKVIKYKNGKTEETKKEPHTLKNEITYKGSKKQIKTYCSICGRVLNTSIVDKYSDKEKGSKNTTGSKDSSKLPKKLGITSAGAGGSGRSALMVKMDSGGYTGDWGSAEGRLAILHEKEQVFNKEDTARLLLASRILQTIDIQARYASGAFGNISSPMVGSNAQVVQQNVQITASFPNAVNHAEIEEAFNNLSNKAVQYANRKNR